MALQLSHIAGWVLRQRQQAGPAAPTKDRRICLCISANGDACPAEPDTSPATCEDPGRAAPTAHMPWEALRGAASLTAQLWWLSCHAWLSCLHSLCERGKPPGGQRLGCDVCNVCAHCSGAPRTAPAVAAAGARTGAFCSTYMPPAFPQRLRRSPESPMRERWPVNSKFIRDDQPLTSAAPRARTGPPLFPPAKCEYSEAWTQLDASVAPASPACLDRLLACLRGARVRQRSAAPCARPASRAPEPARPRPASGSGA